MAEVGAFLVSAFSSVASAVTGVLSTVGTAAGTSAATTALTAAAQAVALAGINSLLTPRPKTGAAPGKPNDWRADPAAPVPVVWGRFGTGGYIVLDKKHGQNEQDQSIVSVLSLGPIAEIERQWFGSDVLVTTNPPRSTGAVPSPWTAAIWTHWQLGATPESLALPLLPAGASFPEWTAAHKLSGLAACMTTFRLGSKEIQRSGVRKASWDMKGQLCYDPRKDSTYPGGSGSHRINNPATWEWSQNAGLCGLKFALGLYHAGKLRDGIGAPPDLIRIADFVETANVSDENEWTIGGMTTTADSKWAVLTTILEAGAAKPVNDGRIGCIVTAPKVSVGTITGDDIVGGLRIRRGTPLADRKNTAIPKFNSEPHRWEVVPGAAVTISEFVTADGGEERRMEVPLGLVYKPEQAAQIAAYRIWETRGVPLQVTATLKPYFARYRIGECLTVTIPGRAITDRKMMILNREVDFSGSTVTLFLQEEVDAKHASALGKNTTAPTVVDFGLNGDLTSPDPDDWLLTFGYSGPQRWINVSSPSPTNTAFVDTVTIYYRETAGLGDWFVAGETSSEAPILLQITGLMANTEYDVGASYRSGLRQTEIVTIGNGTTHP